MMSHNLVKDDERPLTEKLAELIERYNDSSSSCFTFNDFTGIVNISMYAQQKEINLFSAACVAATWRKPYRRPSWWQR